MKMTKLLMLMRFALHSRPRVLCLIYKHKHVSTSAVWCVAAGAALVSYNVLAGLSACDFVNNASARWAVVDMTEWQAAVASTNAPNMLL